MIESEIKERLNILEYSRFESVLKLVEIEATSLIW